MGFDVFVPEPLDEAVRAAICAPVDKLEFGRLCIDAKLAVRLGNLTQRTGRFGGGTIGAQAIEFGVPRITEDSELAAAVNAGGMVR